MTVLPSFAPASLTLINKRQLGEDVLVKDANPTIGLIEALLYPVEALVDACEALVDPLEPLVDPLEPLVDLLEAVVYPLEALIHVGSEGRKFTLHLRSKLRNLRSEVVHAGR